MSRAIRLASNNYPFATRLRARELYLKGRTLVQVSEALGEEADKAAAEEAKLAGLPAPAPSPRIPPTVISYWATRGDWEAHRQATVRFVEKEQVKRIRKEAAAEVRQQGKQLQFLSGFLQQYFMTQKKDPNTGAVVVDGMGRPVMVPRGPLDWPIDDPVRAITALLSIAKHRADHVKLVSDMMGDSLPKIDPSEFSFLEPGAPSKGA